MPRCLARAAPTGTKAVKARQLFFKRDYFSKGSLDDCDQPLLNNLLLTLLQTSSFATFYMIVLRGNFDLSIFLLACILALFHKRLDGAFKESFRFILKLFGSL